MLTRPFLLPLSTICHAPCQLPPLPLPQNCACAAQSALGSWKWIRKPGNMHPPPIYLGKPTSTRREPDRFQPPPAVLRIDEEYRLPRPTLSMVNVIRYRDSVASWASNVVKWPSDKNQEARRGQPIHVMEAKNCDTPPSAPVPVGIDPRASRET